MNKLPIYKCFDIVGRNETWSLTKTERSEPWYLRIPEGYTAIALGEAGKFLVKPASAKPGPTYRYPEDLHIKYSDWMPTAIYLGDNGKYGERFELTPVKMELDGE